MRAIVWAEWLLLASAIYIMIGVVVGVAFLSFGVKKVDSAAIGAPITFRMIVFPGTVVIWPAVLVMWLRSVR